MATTSSSSTPIEVQKARCHQLPHQYQSSAVTPRSLSVRAKSDTLQTSRYTSPINVQLPSRHTFVDDLAPYPNYVTSKVVEASRSSFNRENSNSSRTELSSKSASRQKHRTSRHNYHTSEMTTAVPNEAGPASVVTVHESRHGPKSGKSRTTIPASSGNWVLGKTIGAGSMGKVKLARKLDTGEEVAVKIIPRGSIDDGQNQSKADRERADHSKEVRTAREAAIVTLLNHPFICSMKDVVRTGNHWYMLFEYVNGGQMLDYIISHGRLKEKQARKFSRQIASALDYCHRNSIVHRDLKIENILISKTGDIKIIDFGLSNMFNPRDHLKTFCGSLYFAAPELLQAKQYMGPEVDIWSFGIVLYVLVCGKVPFDDQSMPALHAKIKKGAVDYPSWLSPECKHLISRMLVTDSRQRATLQEIMGHNWMIKGFGSSPDSHLPTREILQAPLDPNVIQAMTGFNFGPPEIIQLQLLEILESPEYIKAVRLLAQERESQGQQKDPEKKRSFGFDFYKRRSYSNSRDTLPAQSSEGILPLRSDPVNAFHPLLSVYYLVKEKQERDRLAATALRTPDQAPLQVAEISAPKLVYTNPATYEMSGENATGGRSRPRARTHGEDEIATTLLNIKRIGSDMNPPAIPEPPPGHSRKGTTAAGILRRFSTRRRKEVLDKTQQPAVAAHSPQDKNLLTKTFSHRRTQDRNSEVHLSPSSVNSNQSRQVNLFGPIKSGESIISPKGLTRSSSVKSESIQNRENRAGVSDSTERLFKANLPLSDTEPKFVHENYARSKYPPNTHMNSRTASRARSLGHARRESIQARRAKREAQENHISEPTNTKNGEASSPSYERVDQVENLKPVFLKGLFSVSTTSTKSVPAIRADIIRVLKQHNVKFKEIKGGFHCYHTPSIDLNKVQDLSPSTHSNYSPGHRRMISLGGLIGGSSERDREENKDLEKSPQLFRKPSRQPRATSITNYNVSDESIHRNESGLSARVAGETSTHVQSDLGGSMILEFEIFIVKVPLLSLYGIQFKRLVGGTWQYKNMADQILRELRL